MPCTVRPLGSPLQVMESSSLTLVMVGLDQPPLQLEMVLNKVTKTGLPDNFKVMRKVAASWGNGSYLRVTENGLQPAVSIFSGNVGGTAIGIGVQGNVGPLYNLHGNIRNVIIYGIPASDQELMSMTRGNLAKLLDRVEAQPA